MPKYFVSLQDKTPYQTIDSIPFCVWHYQIAVSGDSEAMPKKLGLAFSKHIEIRDPASHPDITAIQDTEIDRTSSAGTQFVLISIPPSNGLRSDSWRSDDLSDDLYLDLNFLAPCADDAFSPIQLIAPDVTSSQWQTLPFQTNANTPEGLTQTILAPVAVDQAGTPLSNTTLTEAARRIEKGTLVPLQVEQATGNRGKLAIVKHAFIRQLALQPGEVMAVRRQLGSPEGPAISSEETFSETPWDLLAAFEQPAIPSLLPDPGTFSDVPLAALQAFGTALTQVRQQSLLQVQRSLSVAADDLQTQEAPVHLAAIQGELLSSLHLATIANKHLETVTSDKATPIGMLNLERLEMAPAGVQRGELVATIPLAPLEETAVVYKEWSVTSKEFTSIVVDSLEEVSEVGVTDNTELTQSTSSQLQHSNQFNITGTVSGGIPIISGSTTTTFSAQDAASQSAAESRKHAVSITQKASSRSKQEHKVTISTKTETGTSETTTRLLKNSSPTDPMRIDYFSLMRKWQVRLYRYGLRLTYDVVIPEPAGAMREIYARLSELRSKLAPFEFPIKPSDITKDRRPGEDKDHYLVLADLYHVQVPQYPESPAPLQPNKTFSPGESWHFTQLEFEVPAGAIVDSVLLHAQIADRPEVNINFAVLGTKFSKNGVVGPLIIGSEGPLKAWNDQNFLHGSTGRQTVTFFTHYADGPSWIGLTVNLSPAGEKVAHWRTDVWNALYNAAQLRYFAEQQEIQAQIARLEQQLESVDTLTLRREESDEIMKGVLRFLLGPGFEFMPDAVLNAIKRTGGNPIYGVGFTGNKLGISGSDFALVTQYENIVRFINQAIEWENVVYFLYSYFWDVPPSWPFIRQIRHPDATRQAFLRAGSARVVLTIRKGWEERWVRFQDTFDPNGVTNSPYLTIAREIAAYDDRNYPGIPPANSGKSAARLQDAIYTTSASLLNTSSDPVTVDVESSIGIVPGLPVIIDHYEYPNSIQESQLVIAVPNDTQIVVERLNYAHGRSGPFPIVQPGEKGVLIAEWNEYTPTSGIDIAVTSNLATVS